MMQSRGIVIGMKMMNNSPQFSGGIDLEDLLQWLLYWDNITYAGVIIPGGPNISGNHPPDIAYLEEEGIFRNEFVDITELNVHKLPSLNQELKFSDWLEINFNISILLPDSNWLNDFLIAMKFGLLVSRLWNH